ncbi:hypothetical protein COY90_02115 [Candidatus Roizmanbacteria bacterium CG_4_10_14_0_8_um_filter_39_9]|uniref:DUF4239 domain-containing protein n=1 Tax=Candidatus Roizmanbacteria bacterium CG_4_10_14_0_8_um_filter_39_9 TaxID=1974829 RepID=A0A2M7QE79_9BACT|nr:MAG: hypothetical protein COY90_02115 [Candidatus Roizmanbacteria bacterium CG_4_10_14_0_8_um_filter_39_9]
MKYTIKSAVIFILYSIIFVFGHFTRILNQSVLINDVNGAGWLYSALAAIFGVLAAFTIQSQSTKWDNLTQSIKNEVSGLRRLLWLSTHGDAIRKKNIQSAVRIYLACVTKTEWKKIDMGERSPELEKSIQNLQEQVYQLGKYSPHLLQSIMIIMERIVESREERMFHSAKRTPFLLKGTIYMGAFIMIFLSYFIGIRNVWLDYLFTGSIALLIILIISVIDDFEHPYRPGAWHVTQREYSDLLSEIV